jgi:membrane-associated protein
MLNTFIAWLLAYRYLVLFPIAVIEGPIITIIAGSLAANNQLNFIAAYLIIVSGDLVGDSFYYLLGRYSRTKTLHIWGHRIGLAEEHAQKVDQHFEKHAGKTLFFGKLAFSLEVPVIISAGLARYPYVTFIKYMVAGALPKTFGLMLVGYFFGFSIASAKHDLAYASRASLAALLILVGIIVVVRASRRKLVVQTARHKNK